MKLKRNSRGFTILELMISTMVFSTIVLLVTGVIVSLSRQYYGGLSRARTQEVARTIAEEIAKNIQYSRSTPQNISNASAMGWCIGANRYAYLLGQEVNGSMGGIVRSTGCDTITSAPNAVAGTGDVQMLSDRMRLSNLEILSDPSNEYYQVVVRVALGEDNQLNNPNGTDASCILQDGSEFCAVSEYRIIVVRRL